MIRNYAFNSISINGKEVEINSILSGNTNPSSTFEASTFSFIRDWLSLVNIFSISTSGSTGIPKSITIARGQMIASAQMTIKALALRPGDTALVCLNTQLIAGRMMLVRALENNMKIVALDPSSNPLLTINDSTEIDFVALVPLQIHTIMTSPSSLNRLNAMKSILVGGGNVGMTLESDIRKNLTTPTYQTYGMTETISHIALQLINTKNQSLLFKTLPGITIYQDERNCLEIEAPYLTAKITTNDIVEMHDPSTFKWLGRWDNVINSGGIKIIPELIEIEIGGILRTLRIDSNFFVFAIADEILGSKLILAFEGLLTYEKAELLELLKQKLSKYLAPKDIKVIPRFCYTENGKIKRQETINLL